ncbi:hypothetical protein CLIB1444_04S02410 [[Candida] jaroonii]|uniref:Uncharacterized protein n=1 Tax=[Candida] jaroonii TaxID=467808 RepID=A0ACA9Y6C6_9ASCO|nr:hypothetical protein CLIB1444_04S02410 [[Candida] jaroonii]
MRFVRSLSKVAYESKPKSRFNNVTSAFNFRPKPTQGIIYQPPSTLPSVYQTPKSFLPPNDPRRELPYHKEYTAEELEDMPIIHQTTKNYNVDDKTAMEIIKLRSEDPKEWTVNKLVKKFDVDANFIIAINKAFKDKPQLKKYNKRQSEQLKRVQMWLRNEF